MHLRIPCQALETLPPACEGLAEDEGPVRYGKATVLYFWGELSIRRAELARRQKGETPDAEWEGAKHPAEKASARYPWTTRRSPLARS